MKFRLSLILAFAAAHVVFAQTPLAFEVASIRPTDPKNANNDGVRIGLHFDGAQALVRAYSVRDFVGMAYEIGGNRVEGPEWMAAERYDLSATMPVGSKNDQIGEMVKALMADRFQLKAHTEKKEMRVYVLSRGTKPLLLRPVTADPNVSNAPVTIAASGSGQGVALDLGGGASYTFTGNKFEGKKLDMPTLVDSLAVYMDLPVVNQTGIDGFYDITLEITQDDYRAMLLRAALVNGITLPPQALQFANTAVTPSLYSELERVGLKLEVKRLPMDVVVVDSIARRPTEN